MLPHLSHASLWLAALAAAASLFTSGRQGVALAAVALFALGAALWLRRYRRAVEAPELAQALALDDAAMLDLGVLLSRSVTQAESLADALHSLRDHLIHEIGAHGVVIHRTDATPGTPARLADRFPLSEALRTRASAGSLAGGYAMPVAREGQVVAIVELKGTELGIASPALLRLLELTRVQLDGLALREANRAAPGGDAELFELLTENLPVSLFVLEPGARRFIAINRYAETEFRLRRQAVVGRCVDDAFDAGLTAIAGPAMQRAIDDRITVDCDCEWDSRRGRRSVHLRNFVLRHADGSPRLLVVMARDITDEHRDRRALLESQARYDELAETMDDTLFVSTPDRRHFDYLSRSAFETFGMTPGEFAQRNARILDNVLDEDRPLLAESTALEMRLEPVDITYRIRHPKKGLRWIRSRSRTRLLPDGTHRVYGLVSDVTRYREHEVELERARDEAEAASRAKSQFMANMSHEIRTPMNGILGMTELLLGTPLNDKQRRFARAVYRSGESLLEIINDILDFSKIEAGKLELAPTDFMLRSVVEDTLELLAPRAHEKGLELSFHEAPGVPPMVHGDPLRLRQVLTNLVANAIKFTQQGEVTVVLKPAQRAADAGAPQVFQFEVRDTGIGIEADVMPRLFRAFTQANGGMSRQYGGTGLGLAISRQLIELMGGDIRVQSCPGVGSQFIFSVPLQAALDDAPLVDLDGCDLSALRVLVVEDHETNRTVLENMLGAWGMDVTLAEDGQQALEILRGNTVLASNFDLALVDMRMPRLDGMGLATALQAERLHPHMKMILLSSVSSPDDVRSAHQAGFHRFVPKPVRKAELRQAILGVSAQRRDAASVAPRLIGHVLVVEDNPVNQEVIGQMLRHLGLTVQVAVSALQGLRALCEAHFDLVLMDIQMPGMDGVEALNWFRRGTGGRFAFVTPAHTPVIAVTANALGGDEDRFLALGFDDYLSKPFRQSQLLAMLTKRLSPCAPTDAGASPGAAPVAPEGAAPAAESTVLDAQALARLKELDPSGANQLLARVVKAFETSAARLMPQLNEARGAGDNQGVRHVAHTLKSSSASIGAVKLSQICADIETSIRTGSLDDLAARLDSMCAEMEIVLKALTRVLDAKQ
jgi:signal transduction histidine kinase/CheY-like chemotaxis protein